MSNAALNGLAGAGGGIIAQIITYPLQTVNTRQQTERTSRNKTRTPSSSSSGTLVQLLQLFQAEGWGGLYSGLKPSLVGTATSQGVYYYFYQLLKNRAEGRAAGLKARGVGDGSVGMLAWLVVAAVAGCVNVLLTNPIWVLVTRMQTHTQAEKKIMENALPLTRTLTLRDDNDDDSSDAKLAAQLAKPRPYGTFLAVSKGGLQGGWH